MTLRYPSIYSNKTLRALYYEALPAKLLNSHYLKVTFLPICLLVLLLQTTSSSYNLLIFSIYFIPFSERGRWKKLI